MTDKRIKSYLEDRLKRLESIMDEREWTTSELGDIACCKQTLAFIDSLQEESDGDDLGVIATRDALAYANDIEDECINIDDVVQAYEDGMIAGAQWQKQQDSKLPHIHPRDTIEEYAYQCVYDISNDWAKETPEWRDVQTACMLGAQWQKEKDSIPSKDWEELIDALSKRYPEVSFAKLSRIAVRVSRWQQNQDVKNKLPKVTNRTDLDEYAYQCAYDMSNDWAIENPTWKDVEDACKLGANWQKEQDQSTIELAEDHAMLAGMRKMKEQMMAKAKGGTVQKDYQIIMDDGTYIDLDPSMSLKPSLAVKEGERIKVIVIKED